ncbi:hypothetical protein B0H11DRAFT_1035508 [Mycena galericulata]|nr:hypothetical protein B0H11DRAFT_1035508 [Mycena galericulata]
MAAAHFRKRQNEEDIMAYRELIAIDERNGNTPTLWYYSGLAAAYLNVEDFEQARSAAEFVLVRDPKSSEARYRRAMAAKGSGAISVCLMELYTLLVMDPGNALARSTFIETLRGGKNTVSPNYIPLLDEFPVHGSNATVPRTHHPDLPVGKRRTVRESRGATGKKVVRCGGCLVLKEAREVKVCKACGSAAFCTPECHGHRFGWPMHKNQCSSMARHKVLLRLSEKLCLHSYMRGLLMWYAILAFGMLNADPPPCQGLLIITVAMVACHTGTHTQRLSVERINAAPLTLFDDAERGFDQLCGRVEGKTSDRQVIRTLVNPNVGESNTVLFTDEVDMMHSSELLQARQPGFTFHLYSNTFGKTRSFPMDLDVLFRAIEDEIEFDVDNFYGLRV